MGGEGGEFRVKGTKASRCGSQPLTDDYLVLELKTHASLVHPLHPQPLQALGGGCLLPS